MRRIVISFILVLISFFFLTCSKKDIVKQDVIEAEYTGTVGQAGGVVGSNSESSEVYGVFITIPEDAINTEIEININRTDNISQLPVDAERAISNTFEFTTSINMEFKKSIEIAIPTTETDFDTANCYMAYWDSTKWVTIGSWYDATIECVVGITNHFSLFQIFEKQKQVIPKSRYLNVPYYWQADKNWCSYACMAMLLKANNIDREIWAIAGSIEEYGKSIKNLEKYLEDLILEGNIIRYDKSWSKGISSRTIEKFKKEIEERIGAYGQPVWCSLSLLSSTESHAVLLVGYDENYIYLHDPSGAFITDYNSVFISNPLDTQELGQIEVPWNEFLLYCFWIDLDGDDTYLISLKGTEIDNSIAGSLSIMDWESSDRFTHDNDVHSLGFGNIYNSLQNTILFKWDESYKNGFKYDIVITESEQHPTHADYGHSSANSDRMQLSVMLANGGSMKNEMINQFKLCFGIRKPDNSIDKYPNIHSFNLQPGQTNYTLDLFQNENGWHSPNSSIWGEFSLSGYSEGDHAVILELYTTNNLLQDYLEIPFSVIILPHLVNQPNTPTGPSSGETNQTYTYSTGGSNCSQGHNVEYRFDWGNGFYSNWSSSTSASYSWNNPGPYSVKAQTRCASNTDIVSDWSNGTNVTISSPHTVSSPNKPSGPSSGETNQTYTYSTGGSNCSQGHNIEYRFDWGNGSYSNWSSSTSASYSWNNPGPYSVKAQARCASNTDIVSDWSNGTNVTISTPHTVSTPSKPSGPSSGETSQTYTYSTGGSNCSQGHNIEYRFYWGEGPYSSWSSSTSASHSWSNPDTYSVKAQARCATNISIVSNWSSGKSVTISPSLTTVTDFDGNIYQTIKIGNQIWMAENLKVTHYRDGTPIDKETNNQKWAGLSSGAYCAYNNNESNTQTYGYLYNWYAVNDDRIAPIGWHVPTDEDWKELEMALGMSQPEAGNTGYRGTNEGSKLGGNAALWYSGNLTNNIAFGESGFSALPGGYRGFQGNFANMGGYAYFWSSSEDYSGAWHRFLLYDHSEVYRIYANARYGFSVRLIRDN